MPDNLTCPECGARLPAGSDGALCPACLLRLSLESGSGGDVPEPPEPLERIGSYRILKRIGEGGMGDVWLAEQQEPIRRRVAIKVIKLGMDTRQFVARFESERQVLALLSHPNIARVFDAGEHEGRPYFVMEYVAGIPITDYCDRHRLDTRERLALFMQVCDAIQHAHQKGIVHRDIKPGNVLVMLQDGKPVPKVIDFGVAKATDQRLTEKTLFTQYGLLIGTPEYMSPEQADLTGLDVDTRTDIYSLGVLLYELLIGSLPFDPATLKQAGYDEIRRIIREEAPARPTTRLSGLGESAADVAARRRTDLKSLGKQIQGDLEWITLKSLEKDRSRRYPSASEFAADIERHLNDLPVIAGPPSAAYRLGKFVRKHKGPVAAAAAITATVLVLGSVAMYLGWQNYARGIRLQTNAVQLNQGALLTQAANADDALVRRLLLLEVGKFSYDSGEPMPAPQGAMNLAYELLDEPVPYVIYKGHSRPVNGVDIARDGRRFVSAAENESTRIWDIMTLSDERELGPEPPAGRNPLFPFFSLDGGYLAGILESDSSGLPRGLARVANLASGDSVVVDTTEFDVPVFLGTADIWAPEIAFASPGGRYLVTGDAGAPGSYADSWLTTLLHLSIDAFGDSQIRLRALDNPDQPYVLPETAESFDFSPVNANIAFGFSDGTVEIRPGPDAEPTTAFRAHAGEVTSLAYDASGTRLITASAADNAVRIWNVDGTLIRTAIRPSRSDAANSSEDAISVRFSPAGHHFVLTRVSIDSIEETYSTSIGQVVPNQYNGFDWLPADNLSFNAADGLITLRSLFAAFSPDDEHLMAIVRGRTPGTTDMLVFDVDGQRLNPANGITGLHEDLYALDPLTENARFTAAGPYLSMIRGPEVRIYRPDDTAPEFRHPMNGISVARFSSDGSRVVTASNIVRTTQDRAATLWTTDGEQLATFAGHSNSRPGQAGQIRSSDQLTSTLESLAPGAVRDTAYSDDGESIATAGTDGNVIVQRIDGSAPPMILEGHQDEVVAVSFGRNDELIATASADGTVRVWNARDGTMLHEKNIFMLNPPTSASFNADGTRLVTSSYGSALIRGSTVIAPVMVWDSLSDSVIAAISPSDCEPASAEFGPDDAQILIGCTNGDVQMWDISGTSEPIEFIGAPAHVSAARFSPDFSRVVAFGDDGAVFWRIDSAPAADGQRVPEPTVIIRGHSVTSAEFSPDNGRILLTSDGVARILPATWPGLLGALANGTTACLTARQRMTYLNEFADAALDAYLGCEATGQQRRSSTQ